MRCVSCGSDSEDGAFVPALVLTERGRALLAEFGTISRPGDRFDPASHNVLGNIRPEMLLCLGYLCFSIPPTEESDWYCRKCLENDERESPGKSAGNPDERTRRKS